MDYELLKKLFEIDVFVGYTEDEIAELTEGFEHIPAALLEFWKKCGNTKELFVTNDPWVTLEMVRKYDWMKKRPREYFYLLTENQGVYLAAIRRRDMEQDNPPVYILEPLRDGGVREIGEAAPSVTEFLMGMLIYECALVSFEYMREDIIWYEPEDIEQIESLLKKYPYHVDNWFSNRIDLYTINNEELLFILMGDVPQGSYSARNKEVYDRLDAQIGSIGEA